jgi:hypothetical protein
LYRDSSVVANVMRRRERARKYAVIASSKIATARSRAPILTMA